MRVKSLERDNYNMNSSLVMSIANHYVIHEVIIRGRADSYL